MNTNSTVATYFLLPALLAISTATVWVEDYLYETNNGTITITGHFGCPNPTWTTVSTNTLTDGWSYFSDAQWTNSPARVYRVRSL